MISQTVSAKLDMLCRNMGKIELHYQREALTFCFHKGDLIKHIYLYKLFIIILDFF